VTYLLDTHVFVWLVSPPTGGVPEHVMEALDVPGSRCVVSAVSAFEVATKVRLGKFDAARDLVARWHHYVDRLGAQRLDLSSEHAIEAGRLDWDHRDPFDRLLAAQAHIDGLTFVTSDTAFDGAPGVSVLGWN